jgi:hypothetical protein
MTLLCQFERSGRREDLEEAVASVRTALDIHEVRPSLRSRLLSNQAVVLAADAGAAPGPAQRAAAREAAVASCRRAVDALPPGHPDLPVRLTNLAGTLIDRGAGPDRAAALELYGQVAALPSAPASVRVQAARSQGATAAAGGAWDVAADAYAHGVRLLESLVTRAVTRRSREALLSRFAPLASEAAGCAVAAGSAGRAVELLEHSRAVLWSQALDTGSARALRTADTDWARRLAAIADELD